MALSLATTCLCGQPEDWLTAARCHLTLGDGATALRCCAEAQAEGLSEEAVAPLLIRIMALTGAEAEAIALWRRHRSQWDEATALRLLEEVAWIMVERGHQSGIPLLRARCAAAASASGEPRAVALLLRLLEDAHPLVRAAAIEGGTTLRSEPLMQKIALLSRSDSCWKVRLTALESMVQLADKRWIDQLRGLLADPSATAEERYIAAKGIATAAEEMMPALVRCCCRQSDGMMRLLGCELALHCAEPSVAAPLWTLLDDPLSQVRQVTIQALGLLLPHWKDDRQRRSSLEAKLHDEDFMVRVAAAWLMSALERDKGLAALRREFAKASPSQRPYVVSAIQGVGAAGGPVLESLWLQRTAYDAYTVLNMAVALLERGGADASLFEAIGASLKSKERLCQQRQGLFVPIVAQGQQYRDDLLVVEERDFAARLELVGKVAQAGHPMAMSFLEQMMGQRPWGVSGNASLLLLTTPLSGALQRVEELLSQEQAGAVRLQTALALALWGRCKGVLKPLLEMYHGASREDKERILSALGHLGDREALPHLVEVMATATPALRLGAAAALLQLLYQ